MSSDSARSSNRTGTGVNQGSGNPLITVVLSNTTVTDAPKNPKKRDIMIDATTTGSIVTYAWDGNNWR